ncbi:hypothetical protein [Nocardioides sp.]|uniref:hypothetical protein n=1 Tax=Nocardioides sp. TaxID=35761 RepID=UPI003D0D3C0C
MISRSAVVGEVARTHLLVWGADLRRTLGGRARVRALAVLGVALVALTAGLSWSLAPDLGASVERERAARAVLIVVFVLGAVIWAAFALALPDSTAVDTVLTAIAADEQDRRLGLAVVTLVPALAITLCASLAVAGGLIRDAGSVGLSLAAVGLVVSCALGGMALSALTAGAITRLLVATRLASGATCRGLAATVVVVGVGSFLARVMANIDAKASLRNPLVLVGEVVGVLERPWAAGVLALVVIPIASLLVLVGGSWGRAPAHHAALSARLGRSNRHIVPSTSLAVLELRQLLRYQPNVGLLVLVVTATAATLTVAGDRSPVFSHSVFFALCSLATTSAVTVAGVESRSAWLYAATGRWWAHVWVRLAAYVVAWATYVMVFASLLTMTSGGQFTMADALGVLPLLGLELVLVLLVGAFLPVTEEHGLSAISGEFAAIVVVLIVAFGLPRIEVLSTSQWALTGVVLLAAVLGGCLYGWRLAPAGAPRQGEVLAA